MIVHADQAGDYRIASAVKLLGIAGKREGTVVSDSRDLSAADENTLIFPGGAPVPSMTRTWFSTIDCAFTLMKGAHLSPGCSARRRSTPAAIPRHRPSAHVVDLDCLAYPALAVSENSAPRAALSVGGAPVVQTLYIVDEASASQAFFWLHLGCITPAATGAGIPRLNRSRSSGVILSHR